LIDTKAGVFCGHRDILEFVDDLENNRRRERERRWVLGTRLIFETFFWGSTPSLPPMGERAGVRA